MGGRDPLLAHLEWLRLRGFRPSSVTSRRNALLRMTRALGELTGVTEEALDEWQRGLRIGAAARAAYVSHARSYFAWLVQTGYLETDPTRHLVSPKIPKRLPKPIGEEALRQAIDNAPHRIKPWLVLAAFEGLRASEIANLRREDVMETADPPVLLVADAKGGKQRVLPLGRTALDALREHGLPARGWVFPRYDGQPGPNKPWTVSHFANVYLHSIGLPESIHALRHRAATRWYAASRDVYVTSRLLGHERIQTTVGYVAWSDAHAVETVRALD